MSNHSQAGRVFFSLALLNTRLLKRMDAQLSVHGISFTEYQILHQLSQAAQQMLPRIELARSIGLSASGVTRLIAPMEKLGLVEKESNPRDARMSLVKLSNVGQKILGETSVTFEDRAISAFESLTDAQLSKFEDLSSRL